MAGGSPDGDAPEAEPALDLRSRFWRLVVVFNVAVFGLGVGAMLIVFDARWIEGGALVIGGTLAFAYGLRGYRRTRSALE